MKRLIATVWGKCLLGFLSLLLTAVIAAGIGWAAVPKFQSVTLELGQTVDLSGFLTRWAWPELVTLNQPLPLPEGTGSFPVTLQHGLQQETVTLQIVDTTAPRVRFRDVVAHIDELPEPEDFVETCYDLTETEFFFPQRLSLPESYGNCTVQVSVSDSSGNVTTGQCVIRYVWLYESVQVEYGTLLEKSHLLLKPEKDDHLVDQSQIDAINDAGVGQYDIVSTDGDLSYTCHITVADTTGPELTVRDHTVFVGGKVSLEHFLVSATDLSGDVQVRLMTQPDNKTVGEQTMVIEAEDIYGNITRKEALFTVLKDTNGPTITGAGTLTVKKNDTVDLAAGVKAYDTKDGYVAVSYDDSKLNLGKAGTYYVIYSATDSSGNKTSYRRKVVVTHNDEDLRELIAETAAKLSSDPVAIRRYLRNNIAYQSNTWAKDDPVWQGLYNRSGNCYVQAYCLQALLQAKGYDARIIYTTCHTHYWVLVYYEGAWRHLDSTPGGRHENVVLVNDEVRLANLQGRDWDRSKWPAAE